MANFHRTKAFKRTGSTRKVVPQRNPLVISLRNNYPMSERADLGENEEKYGALLPPSLPLSLGRPAAQARSLADHRQCNLRWADSPAAEGYNLGAAAAAAASLTSCSTELPVNCQHFRRKERKWQRKHSSGRRTHLIKHATKTSPGRKE